MRTYPLHMSLARVAAGLLGAALVLHCQTDRIEENPRSAAAFVKPFSADLFLHVKAPIQFTYPSQNKGSRVTQLTLESFGESGRMDQAGSQFGPPAIMGTHLNGLECPLCAFGMPVRSRATLQPFGAKATLNLLQGRFQLFSSFGGTESWRPEGFLQGVGRRS